MPAGDIKISKLKVGDIDLTNFNQATYGEVNIFEDILNMYGAACEVQVIDHSDALGKTKTNGSFDKDIEIAFSTADSGGQVGFKFKFFGNKNLQDSADNHEGGLKSKTYEIRGVCQELLSAQSNPVKYSAEEPTSKMVETILKKGFKTDKQIDIQEQTKGKRRFEFQNEHPLKCLQTLNNEHVSQQNKSSAFVCFQRSESGKQKYIFATFEHLFKQSSVATLKQVTTLDSGASEKEKQNAILSFNVSDSFFTPTRGFSKAEQYSYNPTTGKSDQVAQKPQNYSVAGSATYKAPPSNASSVPVHTVKDSANDKTATGVADARKNRTDFLSHLTQNHATLEVIGNAAIKLGSIVKLEIPKKADSGGSAGETQFNAEALVVSIRHKIKPAGQSPRYTMLLGVVKGGFKEGGDGNG